MMEMVGAQNIQTNGLSGQLVMVGRNGEINGMRISTSMGMESNKVRHGGLERMEIGGTALGASITMGLDGFTNMERVAAASIGTPIPRKIHGMRSIPTMGSPTVLETLCNSWQFGNQHLQHPRATFLKRVDQGPSSPWV